MLSNLNLTVESVQQDSVLALPDHATVITDLYHTYDVGLKNPIGRRPLVEGHSRWGHGGVYFTRTPCFVHGGPHTDRFPGPFLIWEPHDTTSPAGDVWDGLTTCTDTRALFDRCAQLAGFRDAYYVIHLTPEEAAAQPSDATWRGIREWQDRQSYFTAIRTVLEGMGLDGVSAGGETVIWNYDLLKDPARVIL